MTSWVSLHIHHGADPVPLLTQSVAPLVRELPGLQRFFFTRDWEQGPHIQLRLCGTSPESLRGKAEEQLREFLRDHPPSPVPPEHDSLELVPNHPAGTIERAEYTPDYGKYGGPDGMELAEWHFQQSSQLVLRLLESVPPGSRTVLLGLSAQLSVAMCAGFLGADADLSAFFRGYRMKWEAAYRLPVERNHRVYRQAWQQSGKAIGQRLAAVRQGENLSGVTAMWRGHAARLRERLDLLYAEGKLDAAHPQQLLSSCLHMTNNRLGISVGDEVYLSFLAEQAF